MCSSSVRLAVVLLNTVLGRNRCAINVRKSVLFHQLADDVDRFSDDVCEPQHYNRGTLIVAHLLGMRNKRPSS